MNEFDINNQFDIYVQTYRHSVTLQPGLRYACSSNLAIKLSSHLISISSPQTVSHYQ